VSRSFIAGKVGVLDIKARDRVLLGKGEGPDGDIHFLADHVRETPMYLLAVVFLVVVLIVGRARGILSVVGMVASFFMIIRFVIPGVLSGHSPIVIALIGPSSEISGSSSPYRLQPLGGLCGPPNRCFRRNVDTKGSISQ
jgi:hypothetical protein